MDRSTLQAVDEQIGADDPHLQLGNAYSRQRGEEEACERDVVEADDREVARNLSADLSESLEHADGDEVVGSENGRRSGRPCEHDLERSVAGLL